MARQELLRAMEEAGVVGAGGAGFPTHVKLALEHPRHIIINGVECEPLLRVDQQLLLAQREFLWQTLDTLREAWRPEHVWLAVKEKHREIVEAWREERGVTVFPLGDFYPAGDEQVLVREVLGQAVPAGGLPLHVGAVVLNVETLLNLGHAWRGETVTEKYVTVAGAVRRPQTFRVPVGTAFAELLDWAGGPTTTVTALVEGGPMMGRLAGPDGSVSKVTKGLLVLPAELEWVRRLREPWPAVLRRAYNCEVCRTCTELCPRYLLGYPVEPHRVMRAYAYGRGDLPAAEALGALLCAECGVCENFACPAGVAPRRVMVSLRRQLLAGGALYPRGEGERPEHPLRVARRVPTGRLIARLGLAPYDGPALLRDTCPPVSRMAIPLQAGAAAPSVPVVRVGERVTRGQRVAEPPPGRPGAPVHASLTGMVSAVSQEQVVIEGVS